MALSSLTFLIFLAGALLVYYLVPLRLRRYVLLAASAVFYLSYSPSAGLSLLATVGMTYGAGRWLGALHQKEQALLAGTPRENRPAVKKRGVRVRRRVLTAALCLNFLTLAVYKYLNWLLGATGLPFRPLELLVPLGLSFYIFQTAGYLIDVYRGKLAAERLNIPCYDQELIERFSKESGFSKEFVAERGEDAPYGSWFANALSTQAIQGGTSPQDFLWAVQQHVILDLAQKGPCVIVGRCADYILQNTADCLKVFIHADLALRAKRIVEVYGEREQSPEERLRDKDKRRAAYHRFYTDMKWGHAQNYHLTLDSGVLGIDKCVDIIAELF